MKNKVNLLMDSQVILAGLKKNYGRSGIFFASIYILKNLAKNKSIKVSLYCKNVDMSNLKTLLDEFQINDVGLYSYDVQVFPLSAFYSRIKDKRTKARKNKKVLKKIFYQAEMLFLSPFYHLMKKFYSINRYNCFIATMYKIPDEIVQNKNILKFTVLHDAIPLALDGYQHPPDSWYMQLINSINKNDYYICVSEYTKQDFLKYVKTMDEKKTFVSLLACDDKFHIKPTEEQINNSKKKYNIPGKYVFCLGNIETRKNWEREIRAFLMFISQYKINDLYFVLSGSTWESFKSKLDNILNQFPNYRDRIIYTGYLDDENIVPLYAGAEWFVYTSCYEGFGLPVLEAMISGCPVVASNCTSIPEVTGDCAISVDYDSDEQHIEAYKTYYFDKETRDKKIKQGLERAKMFSWQKCADNIANIMKNSLN